MSLTVYPAAIDSPYDPTTNDTLSTANHHTIEGLQNDAVVAIETKVGYGTGSQSPVNNSFLMGYGAGTTKWFSSPTSPSFTTSILDSNNNTWIGQTPTVSAVNYLNITNAATNNNPALSALGSDSNISLNLVPKGSGKIQDNGTNLIDFRSSFANFVNSGGIWTQNSGLVGSMTALTLFINGVEYSVAAIASHTFGASVDTYIDYTVGTGITYNAVSNNSASFALAANSVRLAIVVTSGAAITSVNQGSPSATAPVASSIDYSVTDSIGNKIYPTDPNPGLLGYRQITGSFTTTATSYTQVTGLSMPVVIPFNRPIRLEAWGNALTDTNGPNGVQLSIWDGTVGSGTKVAEQLVTIPTANYNLPVSCKAILQPGAVTKTYNVGMLVQGSTGQLTAGVNAPAYISVEML